MKRLVMAAILAVALVTGSAMPAMAASSQKYTIVVPRFGAPYYSSTKSVSAYRDLGVRHRYSGGKTVSFQICDSQRNAIGSKIAVRPGGSSAPLVDLWYNSSASAKTVCVKMTSSLTTAVEVLAEGTWYWNYWGQDRGGHQ